MSLKPYLNPKLDLAPLSVHFSLFEDYTLMGMTVPHAFGDVGGLAQCLLAIRQKTRDLSKPALPLLEEKEDPLAEIYSQKNLSPPARKRCIGLWESLSFIWTMIWMMLMWPKLKGQAMYVPASALENLKIRTMKELGGKGYISESDILIAWWLKVCVFFTSYRT
jgi:hypothetical protein